MIHYTDDGRGFRKVFLYHRQIPNPVYADTDKGVVKHYDDPPKLDKWGKRIITRTVRGKVTVEFIKPEEHNNASN